MNCGKCTLVNELMKRGMKNISAAPGESKGITIEEMKSYVKGLTKDNVYEADGFKMPKLPKELDMDYRRNLSFSDLMKMQKKLPEINHKRGIEVQKALTNGLNKQFSAGARGCMYVPTASGFSHWISWYIKDNGKVIFENPQDPSLDLVDFLGQYKFFPGEKFGQLTAIRLDNADLDMSRMDEFINKGRK